MKIIDFFGYKFRVKKGFKSFIVTALVSNKIFEVVANTRIKNYARAAYYVYINENWK